MDLVNVSDLNQYGYCPRRYWYLHYYDTQGRNYERVDGKSQHDGQGTRGGWINELYIESDALGLKGKIDVLDSEGEEPVPVERKRSRSGRFYWNDELQLAGYAMLLEEEIGDRVPEGVIYLFETDERHRIRITNKHRDAVRNSIEAIRTMRPDDVPSLVDNPNKCPSCSTREYCMPHETAMLEPDKTAGTGWEDEI